MSWWRVARMHALIFLAHGDMVLLNAAVRLDPGEQFWDRVVPRGPHTGPVIGHNLVDGHPAHAEFNEYRDRWRRYWQKATEKPT